MLIVTDMFGIYYYLGLKRIGLALMVVFMMGLAILLLLEKNLPQQKLNTQLNKKKGESTMPEEEKKPTEEEQPEEDSGFGDFDTGLPSADEYNKRLEKAFEM